MIYAYSPATGWVPNLATYQGIITGGGKAYWPSDQALLDNWENANKRMLNDLSITSSLVHLFRTLPIVKYRITSLDPEYEWLAEEARKDFARFPKFSSFLFTSSWMFWFGRWAMQLVWYDNKIVDWAPIHPDKIVFPLEIEPSSRRIQRFGIRISYAAAINENVREFLRANQHKIGPAGRSLAYYIEEDERHNFALFRYLMLPGDFFQPLSAEQVFGIGMRHIIYWAWVQKITVEGWLLDFAEKFAFGGIFLWTYPWGNEEAKEALKRAITEQTTPQSGVILFPDVMGEQQYAVRHIPVSTHGVEFLLTFLNDWFRRAIQRLILGQILTVDVGASGMGVAVAREHAKTYYQIVMHYANHLADEFKWEILDTYLLKKWGIKYNDSIVIVPDGTELLVSEQVYRQQIKQQQQSQKGAGAQEEDSELEPILE